MITTAAISFSASPAAATTPSTIPAECAESEGRPANCDDFYPPGIVLPDTPDPTTTTAPPPVVLPSTGSGVSPILQFGTLLLIGGVVVVVAARRREPKHAPT